MSRIVSSGDPGAASSSTSSSARHTTSNGDTNGIRMRHDRDEVISSDGSVYLSRPSVKRRRSSKGKEKAKDAIPLSWSKITSKLWIKERFRHFGEHVARNQIRVLLIDAVIITNLFYPALSIYLQKRFPPLHPPAPPAHNTHRIPAKDQAGPSRRTRKEHPLSLLSTPILDSFFPYPPPLLPRLTWTGWWGRDSGQVEEWTATRVSDGDVWDWEGNEEIRVVRVGWADVGEVLDRDPTNEDERVWHERDHLLLHLVRDTAEGWEANHGSQGEGCVRELSSTSGRVTPSGPCYLLSPDSGISDPHINPLTAVSSNDSHTDLAMMSGFQPDQKMYHSIAALFRVPGNSSATFDSRWSDAMSDVAQKAGGEVFIEAMKPQLKAKEQTEVWRLTHTSSAMALGSGGPFVENVPQSDTSAPKGVLLLYIILIVVLASQISDATKVHSRYGLAFTGVVQICCSAVMSFSVLALIGWNGWGWATVGKEDALPVYILPFVIVVVGVENMSALTKAVFSIPFNYSVPVRIGLGLSKVGTSIALTSLTDLGILSIVWIFVNVRPVREFCLFAATVIITDWFMLHTFFLTVLSIDAQRLELADVLAPDRGANPVVPPTQNASQNEVRRSSRRKRWLWQRLFRARRSKSGSILMILFCIGTIYYLTEKHRAPLSTPGLYGYTPSPTFSKFHPSSSPSQFSTSFGELVNLSTPHKLWRALNPSGLPSLRILIPPASILVMPRAGHPMTPADIRKLSLPTSRLVLPRLKPVFYLFKVVVLPQAVTLGSLYFLLLYLLKDADVLHEKRNRLGRGGDPRPDGEENPAQTLRDVQVHMLPCSHQVDVDLVASSRDGNMVVSLGIDNSICLWRLSGDVQGAGTRESLKAESIGNEPIVGIAISPDGAVVAAVLGTGVIQLWDVISDEPPTPRSPVHLSGKRVTGVRYSEPRNTKDDPFTMPPLPDTETRYELLVSRSDGSVVSLGSRMEPNVTIPAADGTAARVHFADDIHAVCLTVVVSTRDQVKVYQRSSSSGWTSVSLSSTVESSLRITAVATLNDMVALGHRSGLLEVFDATGTVILTTGSNSSSPTTLGSGNAGVRRLALVQVAKSKCTACGTTSDGIFVISSTSDQIVVYRMTTRGNVLCRCTRRTSDESMVPSPGRLVAPPSAHRLNGGGWSPLRSPSLLPPVSNGEFPLSSHGTRRLSTLHRDDQSHRDDLSLVLGTSRNVSGSGGLGVELSGGAGGGGGGEFDMYPLGTVFVPNAGKCWGLTGTTITGIRRVGGGIDDAQWEVWSLDLTTPWNGQSLVVDSAPLASLVRSLSNAPSTSSLLRAQRKERLLSLNGRMAFPSIGTGTSFSIQTYPPLAYVEVRPFHLLSFRNDSDGQRGQSAKVGIVAGFGNRLGLITLPLNTTTSGLNASTSASASLGRGNLRTSHSNSTLLKRSPAMKSTTLTPTVTIVTPPPPTRR